MCVQAALPDTVNNMMYITSQTLGPLTAEDIGSVELGLCLRLLSNEDDVGDTWSHRGEDGRLYLPPEQVSEPETN